MDRNLALGAVRLEMLAVAPREGRVDRNPRRRPATLGGRWVAPREGRVDRNLECVDEAADGLVAPREGRVDRNNLKDLEFPNLRMSRPARGAWIATPGQTA